MTITDFSANLLFLVSLAKPIKTKAKVPLTQVAAVGNTSLATKIATEGPVASGNYVLEIDRS